LEGSIEFNLDLVFAYILGQLLDLVKHLLGYSRNDLSFALDEVEVEESRHDPPLHLPLVALREEESIARDEPEGCDQHIFGGLHVVAIVVLLVELADELRINEHDVGYVFEKLEDDLVVPDDEFLSVDTVAVLLGVPLEPDQHIGDDGVEGLKVGLVLGLHHTPVETPPL